MIKCIRNYHLREDRWMRLDLHAPACAYHQKILNKGDAGSYAHSGTCRHISEFHMVSVPKVETIPAQLQEDSRDVVTLAMWTAARTQTQVHPIILFWLFLCLKFIRYLHGERTALSIQCF